MNGFQFQKQIQDEFQLPVIGKYHFSLPTKKQVIFRHEIRLAIILFFYLCFEYSILILYMHLFHYSISYNMFKYSTFFTFLFQIVIYKDNRPDIISMSLEHGAAQYIVNPFCAEDFRDVWKHALETKKNKLFIDSLFISSKEEETSTDQLQTKKSCSKRSCDVHQDEGEFGVVKKPKLVWTNYLHSRFLYAIRQIGLGGK